MVRQRQYQKENVAPPQEAKTTAGGRLRRKGAGTGGHSAKMLAAGDISAGPNAPIPNPRRDDFNKTAEANPLAPHAIVGGRRVVPTTGNLAARPPLDMPMSPGRVVEADKASAGKAQTPLPSRTRAMPQDTGMRPGQGQQPTNQGQQYSTQQGAGRLSANVYGRQNGIGNPESQGGRRVDRGILGQEEYRQTQHDHAGHLQASSPMFYTPCLFADEELLKASQGAGNYTLGPGRQKQDAGSREGPLSVNPTMGQGFSRPDGFLRYDEPEHPGQHRLVSDYSNDDGNRVRRSQGNMDDLDTYVAQQEELFAAGHRPTPVNYDELLSVAATQAQPGSQMTQMPLIEDYSGNTAPRYNDQMANVLTGMRHTQQSYTRDQYDGRTAMSRHEDDEFDAEEQAEIDNDPAANDEAEDAPQGRLAAWEDDDNDVRGNAFGDIVKDDVVADHRRRNKASKAPSMDKLAAHGQAQTSRKRRHSESSSPEDDGSSSDSEAPKKSKKPCREGRKSCQLKAFSDDVGMLSLATYAKRKFKLILAVEKAFMNRQSPDDRTRVERMVQNIYQDRLAGGERFGRGDVGMQLRNLVRMMFNDQSTFRNRLKESSSKELSVHFREILAMPAPQLSATVKDLIKTGDWIFKREPDSKPFSHPSIEALIHKFFYLDPKSLARQFPESFQAIVPYNVVALAATGLFHCLKEYSTGMKVGHNFDSGEYGKRYVKFQDMVYSIRDGEPRGSRDLKLMLEQWASKGMRAIDCEKEVSVDLSEMDNYLKPRNW